MTMVSSFTQLLVTANGLHKRGFHSWHFLPGMEFGAANIWWGRKAARVRPHEGIDLHSFRDSVGRCHSLAAGTLIPSVLDGELVSIFPDFLGHSLLMAHDLEQGGWHLHSIVAHAVAETGIVCGRRYAAGTIIARIAPSPRAGVPAHLHLSILAFSAAVQEPIGWHSIVGQDGVRLLDPMPWLGGTDSERAEPTL